MADNRRVAPGSELAKPLHEAAFREVSSRIRGDLIRPQDDGYDEARTVFYGGFNRRPALIVRVKDASDVSLVVALALEFGLELSVWSGGHSVAGHRTTEGGIVLDISEMKDIEIDVEG